MTERVLHPLRGSEDQLELTPAQHATKAYMDDAYDAVHVEHVRRDGTAWLVAWRDAEAHYFTLSPDGIPV